MTSKTQSVCKCVHCEKSVYFEGNYWLLQSPTTGQKYEMCAKNPNGRHEVEPVAEPASTGEPLEIFRQLREEISLGSLLSWERNTGSVCTECRFCGEKVAYITKECKHKSDCPYPHILKISQLANLGFVKFGGINSAISAARPSEPSVPPACPECKTQLRDETAWYRCDTCHARYSSSMERGLYRLPDDHFAAPQTSAEHLKKCVKEGPDCDCVTVCKFAAPQPVSGDAPLTTEEKLVLLMEECAEVIKAASKCLRFGYTRNHPSYGDNDKVLSTEIGDLLGVVEALPLDGELMQEARKTKIKRAEKAKAMYGK